MGRSSRRKRARGPGATTVGQVGLGLRPGVFIAGDHLVGDQIHAVSSGKPVIILDLGDISAVNGSGVRGRLPLRQFRIRFEVGGHSSQYVDGCLVFLG